MEPSSSDPSEVLIDKLCETERFAKRKADWDNLFETFKKYDQNPELDKEYDIRDEKEVENYVSEFGCDTVITGSGGSSSRKRIRMSRCGQCEGCNATNCEKCYKCLDMIKYGGPGTLKQACDRRQCINPQMPGLAPLTSPLQYSPKALKGSQRSLNHLQPQDPNSSSFIDLFQDQNISHKHSSILPSQNFLIEKESSPSRFITPDSTMQNPATNSSMRDYLPPRKGYKISSQEDIYDWQNNKSADSYSECSSNAGLMIEKSLNMLKSPTVKSKKRFLLKTPNSKR